MNETLLGATLAGNMLMMIAFWMAMKEMKRDLIGMGKQIDQGIENIEVEIPDLDDLRSDIMEVMGSMHTPTFVDHVGGMLAQWGHAKANQMMQQAESGAEMLDDVVHNDEPPSP